MKRMNLMIDEDALKEAMKEMGETTYSGTVNKALAEFTKVLKVRRGIKAISGMGPDAWVGDLAEMRKPRFPYGFDLPEKKRKEIAAKVVRALRPNDKGRTKRGSR